MDTVGNSAKYRNWVWLLCLLAGPSAFAPPETCPNTPINFGGIPDKFTQNPGYFVLTNGQKVGGGQVDGAYRPQQTGPLRDFANEKGLGSAIFKSIKLHSNCPEKEAADTLRAFQEANRSGVGARIVAARYVPSRGSLPASLILVSEDFHAHACYGNVVASDFAIDLLRAQNGAEVIPAARRMDVALRIYEAYSKLSDVNDANVLARIIEGKPGARIPASAVPLGNNRYFEAIAVDLNHNPPRYRGADLTQPMPKYNYELEAILSPHGRVRILAKQLGIPLEELSERANVFNREPAAPAPKNEGPPRSSNTGPTIVSRLGASSARAPYTPRKLGLAGGFTATAVGAVMTISSMVDRAKRIAEGKNIDSNRAELHRWMERVRLCEKGKAENFCRDSFTQSLRNPEQRASIVENVEKVYLASGESANERGAVADAMKEFIAKNYRSIDEIPPLKDTGVGIPPDYAGRLNRAALALCEATYWGAYLDDLSSRPNCQMDKAQRDAYGKLAQFNMQWHNPDPTLLEKLNQEVTKMRPYDNLIGLINLDTGIILDHDGVAIGSFDPKDPDADIMVPLKRRGLSGVRDAKYPYRMDPRDRERIQKAMKYRATCDVPARPPLPNQATRECVEVVGKANDDLNKLIEPASWTAEHSEDSFYYTVYRKLNSIKESITAVKNQCDQDVDAREWRRILVERFNRLGQITADLQSKKDFKDQYANRVRKTFLEAPDVCSGQSELRDSAPYVSRLREKFEGLPHAEFIR